MRDRDAISTRMPRYGRIGTALLHPLETVLCLLLVSLVVLIFAQVVTRYLLHVSLSWSEEMARYLLMWLAMLSAAYGFKIKAHFALVFLVNRFPEGTRRVISLGVAILVCALLGLFVLKAVEITWSVRRQTGPATGLSKAFPYSAGIVRRSSDALLRRAQCLAGLARSKPGSLTGERSMRGARGELPTISCFSWIPASQGNDGNHAGLHLSSFPVNAGIQSRSSFLDGEVVLHLGWLAVSRAAPPRGSEGGVDGSDALRAASAGQGGARRRRRGGAGEKDAGRQQFPPTSREAIPRCDSGPIPTTGAPNRGDFESLVRRGGNCWQARFTFDNGWVMDSDRAARDRQGRRADGPARAGRFRIRTRVLPVDAGDGTAKKGSGGRICIEPSVGTGMRTAENTCDRGGMQ